MYTTKYDSAIKGNEMFPFAITWMGLQGIMLTEIGQIGKDKYYMISLYIWNLKNKMNQQI